MSSLSSPTNSDTSKSYSVTSIQRSKISLSPAAYTSHTFNAADVNRKVTETLLLKALARTREARELSIHTLLLPQSKAVASSTAPSLSRLSTESSNPIIKASALYALTLYLSNRQLSPTPTSLDKITPILIDAALTSAPRYTRSELEDNEVYDSSVGSRMSKHIKRKKGWTNGVPWGEAESEDVPPIPLSVPDAPKLSAFSESIQRVEGSCISILKMLKDYIKNGQGHGIEECDEVGEMVLVKSGGETFVSSNLVQEEKLTKVEMDNKSFLDSINQSGADNPDGVIDVPLEDDEVTHTSIESELTLYLDPNPLSLTSIRRAGVVGLSCLTTVLMQRDSSKRNGSGVKSILVNGGVDALLCLGYYQFNEEQRYRKDVGISQHVESGSGLPMSSQGDKGGKCGKFDPLMSARSSLSSHSDASFASTIFSSSSLHTTALDINDGNLNGISKSKSIIHKNKVNAYITYQNEKRNSRTAEIVKTLSKNGWKKEDDRFRIIEDERDYKELKLLTDVVNKALSYVGVDDLKRVQVLRAARLRRFLEKRHPGEWAFECECEFSDFFEMNPPSKESEPSKKVMKPDSGLFWLVDAPLSELYSKKVYDDLLFERQLKEAKGRQMKGKTKKKDKGLDLRKRLGAAKEEANNEFIRNSMEEEKKRRIKEKKREEESEKNKKKLMKDLARSTEVLVASLRSDGVDVEEYFREVEMEERREAWIRDFGNMQVVEDVVTERTETSVEEEDDDAMRVEGELERRARLKKEARETADELENTLEEREEREIARVKFLKQEKKEAEKRKERERKLKLREGKSWVLTRKEDLAKKENSKEKAKEREKEDRVKEFNRYHVRLQNKLSRDHRDKEGEWKKRELQEREKRDNWIREEEKKKEEEELVRRAEMKEEEEAEKRAQEKISAIRLVKSEKLKEKREKFVALKRLALARLGGATWMKKDGAAVFYDMLNWKEKVDKVKEEIKEIVGEEVLGLGAAGEEGEGGEEQEKENEDGGGEDKKDEYKDKNRRPSSASQFIEVEVNGKKMRQNVVTQEYEEIK
ncbi:hypothetical protein TL16_g09528 [Triparma laevis f. inornata]|uniref:Uncharacterized protein n=1 Tax=Triparma laevis f. inornata TaxID=1714386 RepID=A0A9W7ELR6_9STRA|nr:hypothetical protein TL16_g09528 [Triparma laevis f. inornata]